MGIAKFDDGIPDHPKFMKAGPVASWLWFCSVCYSRRVLSDGFVPKAKIPTMSAGLTGAASFKAAALLVEAGLFDEAVGGYQVHDYCNWNPSKAIVEDYRKRDRDRKQKRHSGVESDRNPDRNPNGLHADSERRGASRAGAKSESSSESCLEDLDLSGESAREGTRPIVDGHANRLHAQHAWCGPNRVGCVPTYAFHDELVARSGKSDAEVRAWYSRALAAHQGPVPRDVFKFWGNLLDGWIGAVMPSGAQSGKPTRTEMAQRAMARITGGGR